jgi:sialate O-acetylesterase
MTTSILIVFFLTICSYQVNAEEIKVACVGNSVASGYKLENPEFESFPSQLE